ncbi:MAG: flagellar basal body L-ring protein FlgH [Candidatus Electryonea clarkiae]|nr:flagellar basal body L-ring protein FlgH [Candidatus Electryonea clarkiae]MDP8285180.1 flagellar basal body L-ring protein FlgH [Candidatus Electryonea clarkiae]
MMGKMKILAIVFLTSIAFAQSAFAQRFDNLVSRSIFADKRAFYEGDLVTILIMEFTEGQNESGTMTNSDNQMRTDAATSGKMSDMLPSFGLNSQLRNRHNASGSTRTRGELSGKISATILEVLDNGLLSIQGSRLVQVNGEKQETVLTGIVRPEDIRPDNTVYSYSIADAQISYKGKGEVTSAAKPGIIARMWNWIF